MPDSHNHILEIYNSNGETIKGISQIKQATEVHFQSLFKEDGEINFDLTSEFPSNFPGLVSDEENGEIMMPFSEKEIIDVIWSMELDKAPGPYGFSFHFYTVCWNVIRKDLLRMVKAFQTKSKVGGNTNSTFLALIPKESKPTSFNRFKPISLCNASYKILSKLLANMLKLMLGKLISPLQGGFVKGRHILDNVIQVQEAMHSSFHRNEKGMLIKLDMENVFDRVKLSFTKFLIHLGLVLLLLT